MGESKFDTSLRIYFIIAFIHLMAVFFEVNWIVIVTRPLMIPVLWMAFYQATKDILIPCRYAILFALFFSWLADVTLIFQDQESLLFLIGRTLFLIAYIFYAVASFSEIRYTKNVLLIRKPWLAILFIAYGIGFPLLLKSSLNGILIPFIFYECIMISMVLLALSRFPVSNTKSFQGVFAGTIFFLLSDSLSTINKFVHPFILASFFIMFSYILAQVLIVKGIVDQYSLQEKRPAI